MMELAKHIGRDEAHEIMLVIAKEAAAREAPLIDCLFSHAEVRDALSDAELRSLVEPRNHLGLAEAVVDKVTGAAVSRAK